MTWREMRPENNPRMAKNEGPGSFRDPAECYVGNKSHDAHDLLAPGEKCAHCGFIGGSEDHPEANADLRP